MTRMTTRIALAVTAGVIALGGIAAGVNAYAQNTNQDPRPFSGQRMGRGMMGRGGPMGPGGPMMGPEGPLGMLRMLGPQLNLTQTQKDQIKAVADAHRDEWKALRDRARTARQGLHEAIMADTIDDAAIRAKSAEVAAVDADVAVAAAHARAEAWQVLTAAQRDQVKKFQADMMQRMQQRRPPQK